MKIMDRKLKFTTETLAIINSDFNLVSASNHDIVFLIWDEISPQFEQSYYFNEQQINPAKSDFVTWQHSLYRRPNPIYSVAVFNNQIVSSIFGALVHSERILNLWHTRDGFRNRGIGKGVLLNFVRNVFNSDSRTTIVAWDITSPIVDECLIKYGFK